MRYFIVWGIYEDNNGEGCTFSRNFSTPFAQDKFPSEKRVADFIKKWPVYITNIIELSKEDYESYAD